MLLENITLRETSKISANIFADIPHDESAEHIQKINDKIKSKLADAFDLYINNEIVGLLVTEVFRGCLHILALKSYTKINCFETVYPLVARMAKDKNCKTLVWQTTRAGLIELALKNGFHISNVEMRRNIT